MTLARSPRFALAGILTALALFACSRPVDRREPEPGAEVGPAAAPLAAGPKAPAFEISGATARLEVGRCTGPGDRVGDRAGVLGPSEAFCVEVEGSGLAAVATQLRLRLTGTVEPPVDQTRSLVALGDRLAPLRFEPTGLWPLGPYRVTLLAGEREVAAWELEIRAGGESTPVATE